jgi:hypothetical protein
MDRYAPLKRLCTGSVGFPSVNPTYQMGDERSLAATQAI